MKEARLVQSESYDYMSDNLADEFGILREQKNNRIYGNAANQVLRSSSDDIANIRIFFDQNFGTVRSATRRHPQAMNIGKTDGTFQSDTGGTFQTVTDGTFHSACLFLIQVDFFGVLTLQKVDLDLTYR